MRYRLTIIGAIALAIFLLLSPVAGAAEITNTWTGAQANRDWFDTGNWDTGLLPDITHAVIIPGGLPATSYPLIDSGTITVYSLSVDANASLTLSAASLLASLTTNTLIVNGIVEVIANSRLQVEWDAQIYGTVNLESGAEYQSVGDTAINSGGVLGLYGSVMSINEYSLLTNKGDLYVDGGQILRNGGTDLVPPDIENEGILHSQGALQNQIIDCTIINKQSGVISLDAGSSDLAVEQGSVSAEFINYGLIQGSGKLTCSGLSLDNRGIISPGFNLPGSEIGSITLSSDLVQPLGTIEVQVDTGGPASDTITGIGTFSGGTLNASLIGSCANTTQNVMTYTTGVTPPTVFVSNSCMTDLTSTSTLDIQVSATSPTEFQWVGGTSNDWNDSTNWSPSGPPSSSADIAYIPAGYTFRPEISEGMTAISGALRIDAGAELYLIVNSPPATPPSLECWGNIKVNGGLYIKGGSLTANSSMRMGAGAIMNIGASGSVLGSASVAGTLTTAASSSIQVLSGCDLSISGGLSVSGDILVRGALTDVNGPGQISALGSVILRENALCEIQDDASFFFGATSGASLLTVLGDGTNQAVIRMTGGSLVIPDGLPMTNFGRIEWAGPSSIRCAELNTLGTLSNFGDIVVSGASIHEFTNTNFYNYGSVTLNSGTILQSRPEPSPATPPTPIFRNGSGGEITGSGEITLNNGVFLDNNGILAPGDPYSDPATTGRITLTGEYVQQTGGKLYTVAQNAGAFSQLDVTGNVTLDSADSLFHAEATTGASFLDGDRFSPLAYTGSLSGIFSDTFFDPPAGYTFSLDDTPTNSIDVVVSDAIYTWAGAVSSNWNDPDNWSGSILPVAGVDVVIPATTNDPVYDDTNLNSLGCLTIETAASMDIPSGTELTVDCFDITGGLTNFGQLTLGSGPFQFFSSASLTNNVGGTLIASAPSTGTYIEFFSPDSSTTTIINNGTITGIGTLRFSQWSDALGNTYDPPAFSNTGVIEPGDPIAGTNGSLSFEISSFDIGTGTLEINITGSPTDADYDQLVIPATTNGTGGAASFAGNLHVSLTSGGTTPVSGDRYPFMYIEDIQDLTAVFSATSLTLDGVAAVFGDYFAIEYPLASPGWAELVYQGATIDPTLTISNDSTGGSVSGSYTNVSGSPAVFTCPSECSVVTAYDSLADLTAIPNTGYYLQHWLVDDVIETASPGLPFEISMTANHTITPVFQPDGSTTLTISVSPVGGGVVSYPGGELGTPLTCSSSCTEMVYSDGSMTLSASPSSGYAFSHWILTKTGGATGSSTDNPLTLNMVHPDHGAVAVFTSSGSNSGGGGGGIADLCPDDPNKILPGVCGCGEPDNDSDRDGMPDCTDECPDDPEKDSAGSCGCGEPETDSDEDGIPDCVDLCPENPNKADPGLCGCDEPERDRDFDGTPDCVDECPEDPRKFDPGFCGCGEPETDTDQDGMPDCVDECPDNPDKSLAGYCGCDVAEDDGDGDGYPDCVDECPDDGSKTKPGICGCGASDLDADGDGAPECEDLCPDDPNKSDPGSCGCGIPDLDSDQDGVPDCQDLCPEDPASSSPGACGCGVTETDADGDGIADCIDDGSEYPAPRAAVQYPADKAFLSSSTLKVRARVFSGADPARRFRIRWKLSQVDKKARSYWQEDDEYYYGGIISRIFTGLKFGMRYEISLQVFHPDTDQRVAFESVVITVGAPEMIPAVSLPPGVRQQNFRLRTLPLWPRYNQLNRLLQTGVDGYDPRYFRIGAYDTAGGGYIEFGPDLETTPGGAIWFLAREGLEAEVSGVPVSVTEPFHICLTTTEGRDHGWNMVALPAGGRVPWGKVKLIAYDDEGNLLFGPIAVSELDGDNEWISLYLWNWNNGAYDWQHASDPDAFMEGNTGYWVKAYHPGVSLIISPDMQAPDISLASMGRRLYRRLFSPAAAEADNEARPPAPPSSLSGSGSSVSADAAARVDGGGGGCFLKALFPEASSYKTER